MTHHASRKGFHPAPSLLPLLLLPLLSIACQGPDEGTPSAVAEVLATTSTAQTPARGTRGMVSSANALATDVGLEVLEAGGNAFDAAVAVRRR